MDNGALQKIKDAISKASNIGIVVGGNPSLDQMAAALSLYLSLKKANKKTVVASPTNPIVEVSSLVGIDKVQTSIGGDSGDLVVSFPYEEGEIEKVSYTLENNFLNIIVKAGEKGLSFDQQDVRYIQGTGSVDLLFVIGTPRLSDLGELINRDKVKDTKIINIDNKAENQGFGDIVIVAPKASSVSEQVTEVLVELGFSLDIDVSQNLLSGIVSATDDFRSPNATSLAFEMAGILMQRGATRGRDAIASSAFIPRQQPAQMAQNPFDVQAPSAPFANVQGMGAGQAINPQRLEDTEVAPQNVQRIPEGNIIDEEERIAQKVEQFRQQETGQKNVSEDKAPIDWLSPKVYKGSSNV